VVAASISSMAASSFLNRGEKIALSDN